MLTDKTFWKFNTSLIKDKQYLDEINELSIDSIILVYAVFPYSVSLDCSLPMSHLLSVFVRRLTKRFSYQYNGVTVK